MDWTPDRLQAFDKAKSVLADDVVLAHQSPLAKLALTADASDIVAGAVLERWVCGVWQPFVFFSCTLEDKKHKYSIFDRDLLALYPAAQHFRFILEGHTFTAYVDHKPLVFAMSKISDPRSACQQRHFAAVSGFTTEI